MNPAGSGWLGRNVHMFRLVVLPRGLNSDSLPTPTRLKLELRRRLLD